MKVFKVLLLTVLPLISFCQQDHVRFVLNNFSSVSNKVNIDTAEKALLIAAEILSSQEFKDSLIKLSFDIRNIPLQACDCGQNTPASTDRLEGAIVYDSLMRDSVVTLNLHIVRPSPWQHYVSWSYGQSCPCGDVITSFPWWLNNKGLSIANKYAFHIAHEFTHISGYNHGNQSRDDDAAEVVGNIVRAILTTKLQALH